MQNEKYGERLLSDMRAYLENPFGIVESDALGDLLKFVREHVNTLGFFTEKREVMRRKIVSCLQEIFVNYIFPSLKRSMRLYRHFH